ncbi:MAG: hypothetical protein M3X11_16290 [Acidobacteriota bacterium]|nr:hypothetical protein [Acidobacteriota bacterium]
MNRLLKLVLAFTCISSFVGGFAFYWPSTTSAESISNSIQGASKAMREFKGVKLGMKRDEARAAAGKPESSGGDTDEFKLTGDDTMTVRYENGEVKAIQLAFLDSKNAPAWKEVVGDAEVSQMANGAKTARKVITDEKCWVSIYQSKDGSTTRITIMRN